MGSTYITDGIENKIECSYSSVMLKARIEIHGNRNTVVIASGAYLEGTHIVVEDNNCFLYIGENSFIGPSHLAVTEDGSKLNIGDNCMISSNVHIRTGDSHAIFDYNGNRINMAKDINIGNQVWIGEGCKILKGVSLGSQLIVSTGSIVTKSFGSNMLIGGVPARIIKENVSWSPERK